MALFRTEHVTKRYAGHTALDGVSIAVPEKSIFGLLGPNGAGKTSLIRIINRITGPDEGELFFRDEKLQQKHIYRIGYLPEERGLYRKMKVGEHAMYLARLKGLSKRDANMKLREWFEKFGLMPWWNRKVEHRRAARHPGRAARHRHRHRAARPRTADLRRAFQRLRPHQREPAQG